MNAPTRAAETTALTASGDAPQPYQVAPYVGGQAMLFQGEYFDKLDRLSNIMAKAKGLVPGFLLGNPGACFGVGLVAARANFDPFGVARKCWMGPDGTIKYEGQLVIALINNSGLLAERLRWEYFGPWGNILGKFEWRESKTKKDDHGNPKRYIVKAWKDSDEQGLGVRCFATLKGEKEPRVTELLMAQAVVRNSTLWVEDPKQQIGYLSGQRWGRLHSPEAIMGVYTPDEDFDAPRDMGAAEVVEASVDPVLLKAGEDAAAKGRAAYTDFWKNCTHLQRAILSEQTDHHERLKKIAADIDDKRTVNTTARASAPASTTAPAAAAPATDGAQQQAAGTVDTATGSANFVPTYATVFERMKAAAAENNEVALSIAADWIEEIQDPQQRAELEKHRDEFKAGIVGAKP